VRVGIATGLVVVGDASGSTSDRLAVGETPNLAARIQAMAPENGILVSDSTRRMLGDRFELEDVGEHAFKGIGAAVRVWRVLSERQLGTRFESLRGGRLPPLIGRAEELQTIVGAWRGATGGAGRIVLVSGE